jgi:hypothetical protein
MFLNLNPVTLDTRSPNLPGAWEKICNLSYERFVADIAVDCRPQTEPQPEPAREPEPEPAPARRRRRGRYRAHTDKLGNPEAETQEPITCFSPEWRFEAKERRERPPRRYDKVESEMKV